MPESGILGTYGDAFTHCLAGRVEPLVQEVLERIARDVPEMVGPGPVPAELLTQVLRTGLENVQAAIGCGASLEDPFVPPVVSTYARVLAQRGVPTERLLVGYQLLEPIVAREFIESAAAVVEDRADLVRTVKAVLGYAIAYGDAACRTMLAEHADAHGAWLRNREAQVTRRLDAILDGRVQETEVASDMLGYPVSGRHVALMIWLDGDPGRGFDLVAADRRLQALPHVRDTLVVARDERTLLCWLNVSDGAPIDDWVKVDVAPHRAKRVAFGEPGAGLEGFRLSHWQARAAGAVLALARPGLGSVIRYRDVSAISFLVEQPVESRGWVQSVLGDLAGVGQERERLRHTLHVFLEEGENAAAASRRLFVHRNTVKYRVDRAKQLLPLPIADRRLDVALALRYCEWVPPANGHPQAEDGQGDHVDAAGSTS